MTDLQIILLTYVNRSGSTYLLSILDSSDDICACPEADVLMDLFLQKPSEIVTSTTLKKLKRMLLSDVKLKHWGLDFRPLENNLHSISNLNCFEKILALYKNKHKPLASKIVFKAENLIFLYPKLVRHKFLWLALVRDARAVFVSQLKTINPYSNKPFSKNPVRTSVFWKKHVAESFRYKSNNDFLLIYYENLISENSDTTQRIFTFLNVKVPDLSKEETILNTGFLLPEQLAIHKNVTKGPVLERISYWKKTITSKDLYFIQSLLVRLFTESGFYKLIPEGLKNKFYLKLHLYSKIVFEYLRCLIKKILSRILNFKANWLT